MTISSYTGESELNNILNNHVFVAHVIVLGMGVQVVQRHHASQILPFWHAIATVSQNEYCRYYSVISLMYSRDIPWLYYVGRMHCTLCSLSLLCWMTPHKSSSKCVGMPCLICFFLAIWDLLVISSWKEQISRMAQTILQHSRFLKCSALNGLGKD